MTRRTRRRAGGTVIRRVRCLRSASSARAMRRAEIFAEIFSEMRVRSISIFFIEFINESRCACLICCAGGARRENTPRSTKL